MLTVKQYSIYHGYSILDVRLMVITPYEQTKRNPKG